MSRKYSQRGYQDDEPSERRPGADAPRAERGDGPRGRGLGRPTSLVFRCARCGSEQSLDTIATATTCSGCGADLHTCTNCRHFDSSRPKQCRVEVEARVAGKSERNDCDLFEVKQTVESSQSEASAGDARADFDALFKF